jgi:hypothetical protein
VHPAARPPKSQTTQGAIVSDESHKYWYNLETGQVEQGYLSPAIDRAGPFDTAEEAARAPQLLKERAQKWAEDEAREADWGAGSESER